MPLALPTPELIFEAYLPPVFSSTNLPAPSRPCATAPLAEFSFSPAGPDRSLALSLALSVSPRIFSLAESRTFMASSLRGAHGRRLTVGATIGIRQAYVRIAGFALCSRQGEW